MMPCIDSVISVIESWTPQKTPGFRNVLRVRSADSNCANSDCVVGFTKADQPTRALVCLDPPTPASSCEQDSGRASGDLAIPEMPFLHASRCFASRGALETRTGLDEQGERAVRLVRCVMEMAGHGFFAPGIVSSQALEPVATDAWISGRMAANMINKTRDLECKGFKMAEFIAHLYDPQGSHRKTLDRAVCSLSMFSCDELETVFNSHGMILETVCGELSRQTWNLMKHSTMDLLLADKGDRSLPRMYERCAYKSFATDALASMLPIVAMRRLELGIPSFTRQHCMADMLRTIPKAAEWSPLKGTLRLDLKDVKTGHPSAQDVLDALHERNFLLRRTGGCKKKKKIQYEFDSVQLCIMFGRFMNV